MFNQTDEYDVEVEKGIIQVNDTDQTVTVKLLCQSTESVNFIFSEKTLRKFIAALVEAGRRLDAVIEQGGKERVAEIEDRVAQKRKNQPNV